MQNIIILNDHSGAYLNISFLRDLNTADDIPWNFCTTAPTEIPIVGRHERFPLQTLRGNRYNVFYIIGFLLFCEEHLPLAHPYSSRFSSVYGMGGAYVLLRKGNICG